MRTFRVALGVVAFVSLFSVVSAQTPQALVSGAAVDSFGDPVAGASLVAESVSGYRVEVATDSEGAFVLPVLVAGTYALVANSDGFATVQRSVEIGEAPLELELVFTPLRPASLALRVSDPQGLALPGVVVEGLGPRGDRLEGVTGLDGLFRLASVRPGSWRLTATIVGFAPGAASLDARFGAQAGSSIVLALDLSVAEEIVVLGSRRPVGPRTGVRLVDSPVSTTVVSAADLETEAATNLGDALRSVPGLNVIQLSARDVQLTSRQSTGILANTQLVLMDGRSLYLDFFGTVLWDLLPVGLSDIEQIEVVRGPASATWGPNALTGAVHVITKAPRDSVGTTVTFSGGVVDRDVGSTAGRGHGGLFGANATVTRAPSESLAYRISAGYFAADAYARPTGSVPVVEDPRIPGAFVGGAPYPLDAPAPFGAAYANRGTSRPQFDARLDQELSNGAMLTYAAGVSATEGITHTGVGPFDIERGSYLGYARLAYVQGDFRVQAFTNLLAADAPHLMLPDPDKPGELIRSQFNSKTFDLDVGHSSTAGSRHVLHYGGNVRRNTFDLTIAPLARDRVELGAYFEDEVFFDRFRLVLGGRVDKFGSLEQPFFSPRLSFMYKPAADHSITLSYNRAFRAPSMVEEFLDMQLVQPVDLSGLAAFRPLLGGFLPPTLPPAHAAAALGQLEHALDATTSAPFPLVTRAVGAHVPVGTAARPELMHQSVTATELSYAGLFPTGTFFGASVYVNRRDAAIYGAPFPASLDPYTAADPPPGWLLPPQALAFMASSGIFLPRTALSFFSFGPSRELGTEFWLDQALSPAVSLSASYSWQGRPVILESDNPLPATEVSLSPAHRFNVGATLNGDRFLGSATLNLVTRAFWADVLTPEFHGFSSGYRLVDGSFGVRWDDGRITTLVKVTNLLNQSIQQHIFGDILRRTIIGEVRFSF